MGLTKLHLDEDRDVPGMRFGVWKRPDLSSSDVVAIHTVTQADIGRLYNIAYRYYGVEAYWWAIADFNKIKNIFRDMYVGQTLYIPSLSSIERAIVEGSESVLG